MSDNIDHQPDTGEKMTAVGADTERRYTKGEVDKIVEERMRRERMKNSGLEAVRNAIVELRERGYFSFFERALGRELSMGDMAHLAAGDLLNRMEQRGQSAQKEDGSRPLPAEKGSQYQGGTANENEGIQSESAVRGYGAASAADQASDDRYGGAQTEAVYAYKTPEYAEYGGDTGPQYIKRADESARYSHEEANIYAPPSGVPASSHRIQPEFMLTERQRELARAGGMTYREYYEAINSIQTSIPEKRPRK